MNTAKDNLPSGLDPAVEQALYSLGAIAADEYDEGNLDRAKLLHACAATLSSAIPRWMLMPAQPALPGLGPNEPGAGG